MIINVQEILIKAYNNISLVKKYHVLLRRVYKILRNKLREDKINKELVLQIAVKAVNNIASLNKLVPILLIFSTYL